MRVGVVGCGLIAQIMHVPYLANLPAVDLRALADPAEDKARALADRHGVPDAFADGATLLDSVGDDLDAAVVLTPSHTHADAAVAALERDLHTLVEKPIAACPADADRMVAAAGRTDATAMVAYMKRYDPAYERAAEAVDSLDGVDLVTAYDVDPDHGRIVEEVYDLIEGAPPDGVVEESRAKRQDDIARAIGTDDESLVAAYDFQVEHVCHDVNALRGLFGAVRSVEHVDLLADGRYAVAHLTYEDGVECVLESGDSERKWFEESIRVDGPDGMVELDFSNPFVKNTPTELRVRQGTETLTDTVHTPSYEEPFKRELEQFVRCARGEAPVRTPFDEARDDLRLVADLFRSYRGDPRDWREGAT